MRSRLLMPPLAPMMMFDATFNVCLLMPMAPASATFAYSDMFIAASELLPLRIYAYLSFSRDVCLLLFDLLCRYATLFCLIRFGVGIAAVDDTPMSMRTLIRCSLLMFNILPMLRRPPVLPLFTPCHCLPGLFGAFVTLYDADGTFTEPHLFDFVHYIDADLRAA